MYNLSLVPKIIGNGTFADSEYNKQLTYAIEDLGLYNPTPIQARNLFGNHVQGKDIVGIANGYSQFSPSYAAL